MYSKAFPVDLIYMDIFLQFCIWWKKCCPIHGQAGSFKIQALFDCNTQKNLNVVNNIRVSLSTLCMCMEDYVSYTREHCFVGSRNLSQAVIFRDLFTTAYVSLISPEAIMYIERDGGGGGGAQRSVFVWMSLQSRLAAAHGRVACQNPQMWMTGLIFTSPDVPFV